MFSALSTFVAAKLVAASSTASTCSADGKFLGIFPKWYEFLTVQVDAATQHCEIVLGKPGEPSTLGNLLPAIIPVGLAIVDILLRLIALVAVGYIMYGAFRYITSQGEPDNTKTALNTIINALIGLAIAIIASAVVAFIGNRLGGTTS